VRSEATGSAGRLHTLADTASIQACISRPLDHSMGPQHPPQFDPSMVLDAVSSTSSNESSSPMPHSRLRLFRRTERLLPRRFSPSPPAQISPTVANHEERNSIFTSTSLPRFDPQVIEDGPLQDLGIVTPLPSIPHSHSPTVSGHPHLVEDSSRQTLTPRDHRISVRSDWFPDLHNNFDPFPVDREQSPSNPMYASSPQSTRLSELPHPTRRRELNRYSSSGRTSAMDISDGSDTSRQSRTLLSSSSHSLARLPRQQSDRTVREIREILTGLSSRAANTPSRLTLSGGPQTSTSRSQSSWAVDTEHNANTQLNGLLPQRGTAEHIDGDRGRHPSPIQNSSRNEFLRATEAERDGAPRQDLQSRSFFTEYNAAATERDILPDRALTEHPDADVRRSPSSIHVMPQNAFARPHADSEHDRLSAQNPHLPPIHPTHLTALTERHEMLADRNTSNLFQGGGRSSPSSVHDTHDIASRPGGSVGGLSRDMNRDNISVWRSPRRFTGVTDDDYMPAASVASPLSSTGRSGSRSLLDPTLRFGSGPRSSWSSSSERESDPQLAWPRHGLRSDVSSWWTMDDDTDPFDLDSVPSGYHSSRVGSQRPSSYYTPMGEHIFPRVNAGLFVQTPTDR
jgi:hypothetical protein